MNINKKLWLLRTLLSLKEFNNKKLAYSWVDIIKIFCLYEKFKNDVFIENYFNYFNFSNTHLFIEWNNRSVYFPQDNKIYLEILKNIALDIEFIPKKNFWEIISLNWINIFRFDISLSKDISSLKNISNLISNIEKDFVKDFYEIIKLINRFQNLKISYNSYINEYKNELKLREYLKKIENEEYKFLLINRNSYNILLLRSKLRLIKILLDKWYNTIWNLLDSSKNNIDVIYFKKEFNTNKENIIFLGYQESILDKNYEETWIWKKRVLITKDFNINNINKILEFDLIISTSNSELSHTAIIAKEMGIPFILWADKTILWIWNLVKLKINYDKKRIMILK